MKKKSPMRLVGMACMVMAVCTACSQSPDLEPQRIDLASTIDKSACLLCNEEMSSGLNEFRGQDNVGIIDLNTFEAACVEINRYDVDGQLIEEATGAFQSRSSVLGETRVQIWLDVDRGYASISFPLEHDNGIDPEALGGFLCEDHLYGFSSQCAHEEEASGLAIIDLETMEIRALEPRSTMFSLGNYIVTCDFDDNNTVRLLIIYRPVRYHE